MGSTGQGQRADHGRRGARLCAWIALLALVAVVGLASSSGSASGGRQGSPAGPPPVAPGSAEQRKLSDEARRRAERRRSPEERAARERSRVRFRGMRRADAIDLARHEFREAIASPNFALSDVLGGARVRRWHGRGAATIETPDGKRSVVMATSPLTAGGASPRPIDLGLEAQGDDFVPEEAAVPVEIGRDVRDGFAFPEQDLGVRLETKSEGQEANGVLTSDRAFWAGVAGQDADYFAKPVPAGAETYFQLRSAASPERFAFRFDLPAGAELRTRQTGPLTRDTAVQVVRDGRLIAELPPASAHDADGTSVDVMYSVAGNRLVLDVAHRGRDLKYPLLVDPIWSINYGKASGTAFDNWQQHYFGMNSSNVWLLAYNPPNPLLEVKLNGATSFSGGAQGGWRFTTYGHAKIFKVYWHDFYRRGNTDALMRLGIYSTSWEALWNWNGPGFENWRIDQCVDTNPATNCSHAGGTPSNSAAFLLETPWSCTRCYGYPTDANYSQAGLRSVELFIADTVQPEAIFWPPLSSTWVDDSDRGPSIQAADYGVGVQGVRLRTYAGDVSAAPDAAPTTSDRTINPVCNGRDSSVCPRFGGDTPDMPDLTFQPRPPEGVTTLRGNVTDATGNTFQRIGVHKADRSAPNVTLTGELRDREGEGFYGDSDPLTIDAKDGDPSPTASAVDKRAGVKSIEVKIDGNRAFYEEQACLAGSCPMRRDFVFDPDAYPDGERTIEVNVLDQLDHRWTDTWKVTVDRHGDVYRAKEYVDAFAADDLEVQDSEWARINTHSARSDDGRYVSTRDRFDDNGRTYDEVRVVSTMSDDVDPRTGQATATEEVYTVHRGEGENDPNLDIVADVLAPARDYAQRTPNSRGPLRSQVASWQVPPPAYGDEYEYYETQVDLEQDDGPTQEGLLKIWIDGKTKMPLREEIVDSAGAKTTVRYWSYELERLERSELPADFFSVGRPNQPSFEKERDAHGNRLLGLIVDEETGTSFNAYYLGQTPDLSAGPFVFAGSDITRQRVSPTMGIPETGDDLLPGDEPDAGFGKPITTAWAYYQERPATVTGYSPEIDMGDAPLFVKTQASVSSDATAWRDEYRIQALVIEGDPSHAHHTDSGVVTVLVGLRSVVAYVIPLGDGRHSAVMDIDGSFVKVDGTFDKSDLPQIAQRLEIR
jgi:hypothetical protein